MQLGGTIKDKKKTGRLTSWTPAINTQLKRLANYRKGISQRRIGRKSGVLHVTICRQLLSKMKSSCYIRDKTPKYCEKQVSLLYLNTFFLFRNK